MYTCMSFDSVQIDRWILLVYLMIWKDWIRPDREKSIGRCHLWALLSNVTFLETN